MKNFCSNCGENLNMDNKYCPSCGSLIKDDVSNNLNDVKFYSKNEIVGDSGINFNNSVMDSQNKISSNEKSKTNVWAMVGFILSLSSILTCGVTSIFGLIFSIIGAVMCKKYENNGKGFSIAGIIISSIFILMIVLFYILLIVGVNRLSSIDSSSFYGDMY